MECDKVRVLQGLFWLLLQIPLTLSQAYPASCNISKEISSVNGSSLTGNCTAASENVPIVQCFDPSDNIYQFDNVLPTLTGLDGNMWANKLLTLNTTNSSVNITYNFLNISLYTGVKKDEVVMFNCIKWKIGTYSISILGSETLSGIRHQIGIMNTASTTSCDSLVRVCTNEASSSLPVITLQFMNYDWVHLAEVTFYSANSSCSRDGILNPPTTTPCPHVASTTTNQSYSMVTSEKNCSTYLVSTDYNMSSSSSNISSNIALTASVVTVTLVTLIIVAIIISFFVLFSYHKRKKSKPTILPQDQDKHDFMERNYEAESTLGVDNETGQRLDFDNKIENIDKPGNQGLTTMNKEYYLTDLQSGYSITERNEEPNEELGYSVIGFQKIAACDAAMKSLLESAEDSHINKSSVSTTEVSVDVRCMTGVYAKVNKKVKKKKENEDKFTTEALYSVVNKPSTPVVPPKSEPLMKELENEN